MSELKPCPCCGCEAEGTPSCRPEWLYKIKCAACGLSIEKFGISPSMAKKRAIEAWNTRNEPERDFLREVHDWAFAGLEGCDGDEWELYTSITGAIVKYERIKDAKRIFNSPAYAKYKQCIDENIEF